MPHATPPSENPHGPGQILTIVLLYAVFASLWILLSDKAMAWLFKDPEQFVLASTLKGLAFVTVTSLLLYVLMQRLLRATGKRSGPVTGRRRLILPVGMLVFAIVGLTGVGIYYTVIHQRDRVVTQLQAIADLKTRQIESWLAERHGDARFVQTNRFWIESYRRWHEDQDAASWRLLKNLMNNFREHKGFQAILLVDRSGALLWDSENGTFDIPAALGKAVRQQTLAADQWAYVGPYRDKTDRLHLDFLVPMPAIGGQAGPIVVMHVDPMVHLFPLLQPWPIPSTSGETLLFRRDGDQVLFLSELRHQADTAAKLRLPVAQADLLAAKILRHEAPPEVPAKGVDYRGISVIGVAKAIRGTDWYLIAKLDQAELLADATQEILWIGIAGLFAMIMAATGTILFRQRRELDAALRESEIKAEKLRSLQLLHAISEGSGDAIFAKDLKGRYLFFNREAARITEKKAQDVLGRDDTALFPARQADRVMANDRMVIRENRIITFHENLKLGGDDIDFLAIKGPLRDDDGKVIGMFGISRDITELKRAQREVAKREKYLQTILHTTADGFWVVDAEGTIKDVNEAYCRMSGYTRDELLGRSIDTITAVESPSATHQWRERIIERGSELFETRHRRKDGRVFDVELSATCLETEGIMFVCFCRDITERKKIAAETVQLQMRIQQAQKMESIGNLAGGIAHDFNNILFPIIGFSELLLDELPPDRPERGHLREVIKAAKRGGELVNRILTFSRQGEHRKVPVRFQQVLTDVLKLMHATIPSDIEIFQDIQRDCQLVMADATQLHQIAMNLITNAYHAVEENRGTISVSLKETDLEPEDGVERMIGPGRYARLSVSDSGCGIAPGVLDKIFEPYFTTKEKGKGTGLGLSVVYGIVRDHNGDIQVYSEPGRGTTFTVCLPLLERSGDHDVPEEKDALPGGSERILLVDDETMLVRLEKLILERLGYHVTPHENSLEALDAFMKNPDGFDLVLTDMTMPRMTGDELAKALKNVRPSIPVIICTGFSERLNQEKAKALGIDRFLKKPVVRSELARMVREVLDETGRSNREREGA